MKKVQKIDYFAGLNAVLFLWMCAVVYYDRFVEYRGAANIAEFYVYAILILLVIGYGWFTYRLRHFSTVLLVLVQAGILIHFAGAFVPIEGGRLYDAQLMGLRYDKYVHFYNAAVGTWVGWRLFEIRGIPRNGFTSFVLVMTVLGFGALIEIAEYIVCVTIPRTGVGGYDNNMQDLIANTAGAAVSLFFLRYAADFVRAGIALKARVVRIGIRTATGLRADLPDLSAIRSEDAGEP
ncbi:MAG: hypothetical protein U1E27_04795 [Kiritimatiellia bacterium]|nr:hypothetical protein [Kiritimatiellia bacterium]